MNNQKNTKKGTTKNSKSGITLIALVVTIIVLLILAGISISMLSGDNSILQKATDAKTKTERQSIVEQARIDVLGYQTENKGGDLDKTQLKAVLDTYFKDVPDLTDMSDKEIKEKRLDTLAKYGTHTITVSEIYNGNIAGSSQTQIDPSIEYEYANKSGVVQASTLIPGDIINYYYSKAENPIQCVVMYNDNENGLQVISLNKVRDVVLGYKSDETVMDPKTVQVFTNNIPTNYENTIYDKARWSYNHAIETLNEYAEDYKGLMSESARCIGAPSNNIVLNENASDNMFTANSSYTYFNNYNEKYKDADSNVSETYGNNLNKDLNQMNVLGIIQTPNGDNYWLASRSVDSNPNYTGFRVKAIWSPGYFYHRTLCGASATRTDAGATTLGFRPVFILKNNIKIEKTGHQNSGTGGFNEAALYQD